MTDQRTHDIIAAIGDQLAVFDADITRDSRALGIVAGLKFSEESDEFALNYESLTQSYIRRRIEFIHEERKIWREFRDGIYNRLAEEENS